MQRPGPMSPWPHVVPFSISFSAAPRLSRCPRSSRWLRRGFRCGWWSRSRTGRADAGMEVTASPVKQRALQLGLPIAQPEKIKNQRGISAQLDALKPDAIIVVGYGRIIPQWMLDLPPLGNINLHASLLPKYRGAAPIQWAIARGESVTGVTTMRIDAGLDTGDILAAERNADRARRHGGDAGTANGFDWS